MKFEHTQVFNFDAAIRGMRNPKNSWSLSDSENKRAGVEWDTDVMMYPMVNIGDKDLKLMQSLIKAGSEHRKFMRQILISVDITAPLYWWKEFDTYKVGTVANSTSTMHKLASTPITIDCFEMDDFEKLICTESGDDTIDTMWTNVIKNCEWLRCRYNSTKDKRYWKELIRLLPESWLQTRTVTMNYENIYSMIRQRKNHKLSEWSESFVDWCHDLPYAEELLFITHD